MFHANLAIRSVQKKVLPIESKAIFNGKGSCQHMFLDDPNRKVNGWHLINDRGCSGLILHFTFLPSLQCSS